MKIDLRNYDNLIFDCDGVILDSNLIKTEAFYLTGIKYSEEIADVFVDYHKKNGGISRFEKIKYLHKEILKTNDDEKISRDILDYGNIVITKLESCQYINGFLEFTNSHLIRKAKKYIVSGGLETELVQVFEKRKLSSFFNGIGGSPRTKYSIIESLNVSNEERSIFFGDSLLDYQVAENFGFDFVFLYGKTEFKDWKLFFNNKEVIIVKDWLELMTTYI